MKIKFLKLITEKYSVLITGLIITVILTAVKLLVRLSTQVINSYNSTFPKNRNVINYVSKEKIR